MWTKKIPAEQLDVTGAQNLIFTNTTDSTTHTGTLTNTLIWSEDISNKLNSGDIAEVISQVVRVSGSTAATIRYYLNSSASLSGATQINGTVSGTLLNDYIAFGNYADVTVDLASLHIIFAIALGNTGDQFFVSSRKMIK